MTNDPSLLLLYTDAARPAYAVTPGSSIEDLVAQGINPCSFSGLAIALRGTYRAWNEIRSYDDLRGFDTILVVPKLHFRTEWLREAKQRFPNTVFIGQFEENVRKHKLWCRSWEFQKSFYEFAQLMDVMTTFNDQTHQYYELFSKNKVEYLPHPYPLDCVNRLGVRKTHRQKQKLLLKAGHIHGRVGADGFADVVPLIHLLEQQPDYQIQIIDYPRTTEEMLWVFDIRGRQDKRPLERLLWRNRIARNLPKPLGKLRDLMGAAIYRPAPAGRPADPLLLRGVDPRAIVAKRQQTWREMLEDWGRALLGLDLDTCFTVGRNVADAVAVGTPIIGCNSDFQQKLLPELAVGELDYELTFRLARRLVRDPEFHAHLCDLGWRRLQAFRPENIRSRLLEIVGQAGHLRSLDAV